VGFAPKTVAEFIHHTTYHELPDEVVHQAKRCLLDLVGVAAAGTSTNLSQILYRHALRHSGGSARTSRLLFEGRRVGAADAALANAGTIDSMDGHDGHRLVKGHAGAAILPAVLAFIDETPGQTVNDLLTALTIGYEIALRAGITLHRTAADYHSSGAWNAVGAAAVGARLLGLGAGATGHALGIAEYSAPRGPMMRAISHPTMVKDSSAWGAQAGVSAAFLAADGFTGFPAELLEGTPETGDLGVRWRIMEQYFKPYPVCRWSHPAIQAGLNLTSAEPGATNSIRDIEVITFDAATRLHTKAPKDTEEAQYSLPFALASAMVHGELAAEHILTPQRESGVLRLAQKIRLTASDRMSDDFPAVRRAQVNITYEDGRTRSSAPVQADGDPESPLSDGMLLEKFYRNTDRLGAGRSAALAEMTLSERNYPLEELTDLLMHPLDI
jgi:2-methylcitrate dehydratase PrpD